MQQFLENWASAAMTTLGFFWMALWAFCLGYLISSMIQVFITRERMRRTMGTAGPKSVAMGTFFGFISSSCSFAALSTSRALYQKGAGLVPALAFLLASTNLVIELGILIFIFLSWQFVVGEYIGGLVLIGVMWLVVKLTLPKRLAERAREHAQRAARGGDEGGDDDDNENVPDWRELIRSRDGWVRVSRRYFMEWGMVWKDVTFGFTVAGVIAAFVPPEFFRALFIGSAAAGDPAWWQVVLHTLIGPLAAFFTFIGSMGNIPLAAILFGSGVSFAGVMAFIFSDLVVFPVLRISAQYFGWRMAAYILGVFLICLVTASLVMHYGLLMFDALPDPSQVKAAQTRPDERFAVDYTLFLNIAFLGMTGLFFWLPRLARRRSKKNGENGNDCGHDHDHDHGSAGHDWIQRILLILAIASYLWLAIGAGLWLVG